jgi:hypothetical protein
MAKAQLRHIAVSAFDRVASILPQIADLRTVETVQSKGLRPV